MAHCIFVSIRRVSYPSCLPHGVCVYVYAGVSADVPVAACC